MHETDQLPLGHELRCSVDDDFKHLQVGVRHAGKLWKVILFQIFDEDFTQVVLVLTPTDRQLECSKSNERGAHAAHHCSRFHLHVPVVQLHSYVMSHDELALFQNRGFGFTAIAIFWQGQNSLPTHSGNELYCHSMWWQ
jgi:hypothetical protein